MYRHPVTCRHPVTSWGPCVCGSQGPGSLPHLWHAMTGLGGVPGTSNGHTGGVRGMGSRRRLGAGERLLCLLLPLLVE